MRRNILVLTYWPFGDALIRTYTLPYLRIIRDLLPEGSRIFLVTLERENANEIPSEIEKGISHFSFPLHPFGIKAAFSWLGIISRLKKFIRSTPVDTIHTWCTPAGGIGWWLSKKTGVPLVIDSFEPHAEPMVETGTWKKGGIAFRILFYLEKKQVFHAKWIIGVVSGMKEYARSRYGYSGENFFTKPACIDTATFSLSRRKKTDLLRALGLENKIVCVYAGKFGGLYLRDEFFRFAKAAAASWPDRFRVLLLSAVSREEIESLCAANGLDPAIVISKFVPHEAMPDYLGLGDFAFSAFKPVPSRRFCTPIKNGEYWAMGLPVVIPDGISEDSDLIAKNNAGAVLHDFSPGAFDEAIQKINGLLTANAGNQLAERIHELAIRQRNFKIAADIYRKIYST